VGLVLSAEAVGALLIHEHHSFLTTALIVAAAIMVTVLLAGLGLDKCVEEWDWAANLFGARLRSKAKVHGYWYSTVRHKDGHLLGGSVFRIQAGIDGFVLKGDYMDLKTGKWNWWSGKGSRFSEAALLYGYDGEEGVEPDVGFGMYTFADGNPPERVSGNFYGKNLPQGSKYRSVAGKRCPRMDVTRRFRDDLEVRKGCLEHYLDEAQRSLPSDPAAGEGL
jgi:hypothetical protein